MWRNLLSHTTITCTLKLKQKKGGGSTWLTSDCKNGEGVALYPKYQPIVMKTGMHLGF